MQILWSNEFEHQAEKLSRKHRTVFDDIAQLIEQLESGQQPGYFLRGLGGQPLKWTRLRNRSARRGKSGGFRVVYYVGEQLILLVMIDTRADIMDVSRKRLLQIVKDAGLP